MIAISDEGFLKARLIPIHGFRTNGSYLLLRPIHARHPVLKFAAHLPLRGHSAIKLAAGDNPRTTTSIFAMPTRIGRRFSCARFRETGLLSFIASYAGWLISFPWERNVLNLCHIRLA